MKDLRENNPDSVTSFYISGNPGCGKSQFARLLGEAMYAEGNFSFVFTLDASSSDSLYNSMFNLALRLGWSAEYIANELSKKETFHTTFQSLCHLVGIKANLRPCWLVIVDGIGVGGLEQEMKFWKNPGIPNWGVGQVFITTQCEDDIPEGKRVLHERFQQGLEEEEAIELLKKVSMADQLENGDIPVLKRVAMELDYQPLALINAATYTRQISRINSNFKWDDYLEKLRAGKQETMEYKVAKKNESYPNGMVLATRLVIEEVFNSSEILKYIFLALSFCSHAPVPVDLLISYVKSKIEHVDNEEVLVNLKECCLFLWREQSEVNTVNVHQVTYQRFLELPQNKDKDINSEETLFSTWLDTIENFTTKIDADEVSRTYTILSLLKPHLPVIQTRTSSSTELQSFTPPVKNTRCRSEYQHRGFLKKLEAFRNVYKKVYDFNNTLKYEHAIFQIQKLYPDIPVSETFNILHRLGNAYFFTGNLQKAEEYFLKSLEMKKRFHGESSPAGIAKTLLALGDVYILLCDLQKAEEYLLKSLEMEKSFHSESSPGICNALHSLASVYQQRGNVSKAEEHFLKCLEIEKSCYGENCPSVAATLHALGSVYYLHGSLQKAEEYLLKSLKMKKSFYGESSPSIAITLHELGSVYQQRGDLKKAEEYLLKSLEIKKLFHGESSPITSNTLHVLGSVYQQRGNLQKAEEYLLKSLEIGKSFNGESSAGIAVTLHELGSVYHDRGSLQKAEEYLLKSLEMKKSFHGESSPGIAATLHALGSVHQERGNLQKAEEYLLKSLEMEKSFHSESSPAIAAILHAFGNVYQRRGNLQKAEEHLLKSLEMAKLFHGESSAGIAVTLHDLGRVYQDRDNLQKAEEYLLKSLEMKKSFHGESSPIIAVTLYSLGSVYQQRGNLQKAEEYLLKSLEMRKSF